MSGLWRLILGVVGVVVVASFVMDGMPPSLLRSVLLGGLGGLLIYFLKPVMTGKVALRKSSAAEREQLLATAIPPPGKALLYVARSGMVGFMYGYRIELDGSLLASLKSPRYLRAEIAPGPHTLYAGMTGLAGKSTAPAELPFLAAPGEVVIITLTTQAVAMAASQTILTRELDNAAALSRIAAIKQVPVQS